MFASTSKIGRTNIGLEIYDDFLQSESSLLIIITLGGEVEVRCGRRLIIARNPVMIPALSK